MKSLRRLFRGYLGMVGGIVILGLILLAAVVVAGGAYFFELLFFYLLLAVLVIVGLLVFGILVLSRYEKVKQELWKIPGFSANRLEREAGKAPKIKNVVLCSDGICYYGSTMVPQIIPIHNILWAYQGQEQGEGFGVVICTIEGEKKFVPVIIKRKRQEAAIRYVLRLIARKNKGVLIGYRQEYEQMLYQDLGGLRLQVQQKELVDSASLEQEYMQNNYYTLDFQ